MAEPLKNSFGPEVPAYIASLVGAVMPRFPRTRFVKACLDGYEDLELIQRGQHIANALVDVLPDDPVAMLQILIDALAHEGEPRELHGMGSFRYLPIVCVVAAHGLDQFELAMQLQYEVTQRFTAEFSIRPYLELHRDATLARLRIWTADPSEHVRRLVSEGTRPRLPWAPRLRSFMDDPTPVIELLELLKDDPSEYVRRSVANNLNDIAKDHPEVVVALARRWWSDGGPQRRRLLKHGLRTLIKQGHPDALAVIGYAGGSPIEISSATWSPETVRIGGTTAIEVELRNPTGQILTGLVDLAVYFVKANGSSSKKVFKGAEVVVEPGGTARFRKTVSLRSHTTRTPYPGTHATELLVNGAARPIGSFEVLA